MGWHVWNAAVLGGRGLFLAFMPWLACYLHVHARSNDLHPYAIQGYCRYHLNYFLRCRWQLSCFAPLEITPYLHSAQDGGKFFPLFPSHITDWPVHAKRDNSLCPRCWLPAVFGDPIFEEHGVDRGGWWGHGLYETDPGKRAICTTPSFLQQCQGQRIPSSLWLILLWWLIK